MFLDNLYQIKTIINHFSKIPKIMRLPETLTKQFLKLEEIENFYWKILNILPNKLG